ncbi:hypothetical protein FRACYDRAFT_184778 [Fragilariopsis cylindrus CCMP1102]|uniref:Alpha-ketoglutarate-dependent dioxygenase AlkB-like domain-containing protein n=1 Tax=Fragilariopsis cylindrus CCMP1102 TaxID=635003 RepID=A0A1E7FIM6_9STRA|nr:hypothetical protein FRACYDRAFT_184778 [Fragilariopsis cylindrus CCMP1102]|eukprot:OEU18016.1 hypothetical protein FRACYDRAFT_184778 [Fragilariopsis cylindrus CCMP1102]
MSTSKNVNAAAKTKTKTKKNDASSKTTTKISVFKKACIRHKRRGNDPNRIDDLLVGSGGCADDSIIDVKWIHYLQQRSRRKRRKHPQQQHSTKKKDNDDDGNCDSDNDSKNTTSDNGGRFNKDLVFLIDHHKRSTSTTSTSTTAEDATDTDTTTPTPPRCYGFHEYPGVYIYPNALSEEVQLQLSYEAVTKYCEHSSTNSNSSSSSSPNASSPNAYRTNTDLLPPKTNEQINDTTNNNISETMWNLWKQEQEQSDSSLSSTTTTTTTNYYRRFSKLSWSTMGYHYDWNKRQYHPDQKLIVIPSLVTKISKYFASASLLYNNQNNIDNYSLTNAPLIPPPTGTGTGTGENNISFIPSASIVNYYTEKSNFGGHRDDLEHINAMDKPIVSISTGLPAIFILGGYTIKDEYNYEDNKNENDNDGNENENENDENHPQPHPVRAILIRPGDVLIMGGPSRLNYHAVARIVPYEAIIKYDNTLFGSDDENENNENNNGNNNENNTNDNAITDEKKYLKRYLKDHRININVRQVYPDQK